MLSIDRHILFISVFRAIKAALSVIGAGGAATRRLPEPKMIGEDQSASRLTSVVATGSGSRGEMAELFAGPEWTTLCDAEGELTTRGVRTPAAFFVARRRRLQPR